MDSSPPSDITILDISDGLSQVLTEVPNGSEIRHAITSDNCLSVITLQCMATHIVGMAEKKVPVTVWCKLTFPGFVRNFEQVKTFIFSLGRSNLLMCILFVP